MLNGSTRSQWGLFSSAATGSLVPSAWGSHLSTPLRRTTGPLMNAVLNVVRSSRKPSRASMKPPSASMSSSWTSARRQRSRASENTASSARILASRRSWRMSSLLMGIPDSWAWYTISDASARSWAVRSSGKLGLGVGRIVHGLSLPEPSSTSDSRALACRALVANNIM